MLPKYPMPRTQRFCSRFCLAAFDRFFSLSCKTKPGTETLGSRLLNSPPWALHCNWGLSQFIHVNICYRSFVQWIGMKPALSPSRLNRRWRKGTKITSFFCPATWTKNGPGYQCVYCLSIPAGGWLRPKLEDESWDLLSAGLPQGECVGSWELVTGSIAPKSLCVPIAMCNISEDL